MNSMYKIIARFFIDISYTYNSRIITCSRAQNNQIIIHSHAIQRAGICAKLNS
jgi:hypothetical protein